MSDMPMKREEFEKYLTDESQADFIQRTNDVHGHVCVTLLEALEVWWLSGVADDVTGDVDGFGHFYRVGKYIVKTNYLGQHFVEHYGSVDLAKRAFRKIEVEYEEWMGE